METPEYHPFRSVEAKERFLRYYDAKAKQCWPVVSENKLTDTLYGQTFVRISGPSGAPPLVLLPAAASTSLMWAPNIKALAEHYRTYAVDTIYDFGRSVYARPIKSPEDYMNWLDSLFDALELRNQIQLMGLSYGGWLTGQYALRFPNRLRKIVLLAPGATVLPLRLEFWLRTLLAALPFRYFSRSMMQWLFGELVRKGEPGKVILEEALEDLFIASQCFKRRGFVNLTVLTDQELQGMKVPAFYVIGENEKIYSAKKAVERLTAVAPQIKTAVIPNAGHDLAVVQADMVNRKVLEFLKEETI